MRQSVLAGLLIGVQLGAPALAQSSPLVGTWDVRLEMPQGRQEATMTISGSGGSYEVTFADVALRRGPAELADRTSEVVVGSNRLSFTQTVSTPGDPIIIRYAFEVEGDALRGEARVASSTVQITGTRR